MKPTHEELTRARLDGIGGTQRELNRLRSELAAATEENAALKMANGALRGFVRQLVGAIIEMDAPFSRAKTLTERIP